MQKKLYKYRSMHFNPHEHIMYKILYSQNATDRETQVFIVEFGGILSYLFLGDKHFHKQKYHQYVYHKKIQRYLILKQEWEAKRIPIRQCWGNRILKTVSFLGHVFFPVEHKNEEVRGAFRNYHK